MINHRDSRLQNADAAWIAEVHVVHLDGRAPDFPWKVSEIHGKSGEDIHHDTVNILLIMVNIWLLYG